MAVPVEVVCASANPDKVAELAAIVEEVGLVLRPRPAHVADVDEHGATLEENARLKAEALVAATGQAALADDTGLEVDALGGEPGVRSARWAGEGCSYADNVAKLLEHLHGVPAPRRTARFRTVVVLRWPDGREVVAEGAAEGTITEAPKGDGGFGYDPVFVPADGDGRTFAELPAAAKHAISHRGRALRALAEALATA